MKSKNQLILPYFTAILLGLLINTSLSQAQSDNNGSKRVTTSYFLSGATIIPYPGKILSEYDILFKNGVIVKIGKNLQPPSNAKEINGKSLFVYPGFIDFGNKLNIINLMKTLKKSGESLVLVWGKNFPKVKECCPVQRQL